MKFKTKILLTPIVMFCVIFFVIGIVISTLLEKSKNKQIEDRLQLKVITVNQDIKRVSKKALSESSIFAGMPEVKKAYKKFYETNSVKKGSKILFDNVASVIKNASEITGKKRKFIFIYHQLDHLPECGQKSVVMI